MKKFWEQSPEWLREQEAWNALEAAKGAWKEAGRDLLVKIECYGPQPSTIEDEARTRFFEACGVQDEAREAWVKTHRAFKASAAGQAYARYLKDPLAPVATESEAA
jgi:hypothetical protein